jgi:hypothetical protein
MERAIGATEFKRFKAGEKLSSTEMILAKCFECTGFYGDGREDCTGTDCPLYGKMPYRKGVEGEIVKPKKLMPKSCARCEYPDRENAYVCSKRLPQIEKEGRLYPKDENICWKGRIVRGGKNGM